MKNRIATFLKEKRKSLKLSQQFVADELAKRGFQVSPKTLYGYENADRQPNADMLLVLCEIYGVHNLMSELGCKTKENSENFDSLIIKDEPHKTTIRKYLQLNQAHQTQIQGMVLMLETSEREQQKRPSDKQMSEDMRRIIGDYEGYSSMTKEELTFLIESTLIKNKTDFLPVPKTIE